jgi:hypothetical protein
MSWVARADCLHVSVRKTPRWPRSWASCSRLQLQSHGSAWASTAFSSGIPTGMHGQLAWFGSDILHLTSFSIVTTWANFHLLGQPKNSEQLSRRRPSWPSCAGCRRRARPRTRRRRGSETARTLDGSHTAAGTIQAAGMSHTAWNVTHSLHVVAAAPPPAAPRWWQSPRPPSSGTGPAAALGEGARLSARKVLRVLINGYQY